MKNKLKVICLINARGGSKSIPNKNIKNLMGAPLIAWTIKIAIASKSFSRIIVNTDSKKIAKISKKYGAEVPFYRPKNIATDKSKQIESVIYFVKKLIKLNANFDAVAILQPTFPLRTVSDIRKCIKSKSRLKS